MSQTHIRGNQPRPLRILVVDDDEDTAISATRLLQARGHEVESAQGGNAALARMDIFRPELVILDLSMPGLNGVEVGREIRRMDLTAEPALAAYSGWSTPRMLRECAEAGFDHFLVKPAEQSDLDQLVGLVHVASRENARFKSLVTRFEESVYTFTCAQLEFCALVLDSLPKRKDPFIRQRQILRMHRTLALASAWLGKQATMPTEKRIHIEEEIARLYRRLEGISA